MNYLKNISKFDIVNKEGQRVVFTPNGEQEAFINSMTGKDIILKARQIGFSSLVLAIFTVDFLAKENSRSVCISHDSASAQKLLDRVKFYVQSVQDKGVNIKLKYNSRKELVNEEKNSSFYIGQAGSKSFGRSDTLTNLLLSEFAFYPDPKAFLASALQALVPDGKVIIESTANGMNFFKEYWDESKVGNTGFTTHFYSREFYSPEFLRQKQQELGEELFMQEYPSTDTEAFISSGNPFFDKEALAHYLANTENPIQTYKHFNDLLI